MKLFNKEKGKITGLVLVIVLFVLLILKFLLK